MPKINWNITDQELVSSDKCLQVHKYQILTT